MKSQHTTTNRNKVMDNNTSSDRHLSFHVNGERFDVPEIDPSTTLLQFLRSTTRFKSVKLGCGEGGCGACVSLLSRYNPTLKQVEDLSISSCLTLLHSLHNCSITTSEGIGNSKDGFHPIHQRFASFFASQCGFCTPGFCMSLFSALINSDNPARPGPLKITALEAERSVAGNLCRCTGYRPIADACKSFASDVVVDLEDLGTYARARSLSSRVLNTNHRSYSWYSPVTIEELQGLLLENRKKKIKLVVGNTGDGYYKETEKYDEYIDLRFIPELTAVMKNDSTIEFGAALSISKVISHLKENISSALFKIAEHMEKVATPFVRNSGSIGGNLIMSQRKYFPSDIALLLLGAGASLKLLTGREQETITIDEFLCRPALGPKDVLLSVFIPLLDKPCLLFESYRTSPRPLGNALPYLTAAFLADVSEDDDGRGTVVKTIRLAFGSYGTKHPKRGKRVERYLTGKVVNVEVIKEAIRLVKGEVVPEEGTSHAAYRTSLAVGFLFRFLGGLMDSKGLSLDEADFIGKHAELLSSAKQVMESREDYYPVGLPLQKVAAALQASGEAVYVDDIPSPPNCLYGAFIYSTVPSARVKAISFDPEILISGVAAVISAKDIPEGGENIGSSTLIYSESLFPVDFSRCAGDRLAFVIADTQKHADLAARAAIVEYDNEGLEPPILTVEQAVERSSFFEFPPSTMPEEVGDFQKGMDQSDYKILNTEIKLGSQYYFYMETQTALAVPDEDNCMVVYSSVQNPEYVQIVIAKCLGVPEHNIRVITRRAGGGFGGKSTKAIPVATACALAAHKLRRPVRTYLNRNTDMIMTGGRHPLKITYTVGFKSDGNITALHVDILIDAGITEDASYLMPIYIVSGLKKYDWGALSFDIKVCKTDLSSKTIMRAPGDLQGSYVAEAIIEHVASFLSMEVDAVRNKNFHTYESSKLFYGDSSEDLPMEYTLPGIWDSLGKSSSFVERLAAVESFNASNVWGKRGISRVPAVFELTVRPAPGRVSVLRDGSIVVEVGGIELGQGLYTKVRQVAAYGLGLIKCDGTENLVERIRVVQADTLSLVQGGVTGGSTTSESSCEAARICCGVLVERLKSVKEKSGGCLNWDALILQAHNENVNMAAANSYFVPESESSRYLTYGAGVSEVEVDVLTGETKVLRTDIVYDCGQSMNPGIDMGQIEGAFVQGLGFFMHEEYLSNSDGLLVTNSTWNYKIPSMDNIPKQFNVEVLNSGRHPKRILSSKASGEPPLLLSASVHCATRAAVKAARKQLDCAGGAESSFQLEVPAVLPVVKETCGLDVVERYLQSLGAAV